MGFGILLKKLDFPLNRALHSANLAVVAIMARSDGHYTEFRERLGCHMWDQHNSCIIQNQNPWITEGDVCRISFLLDTCHSRYNCNLVIKH